MKTQLLLSVFLTALLVSVRAEEDDTWDKEDQECADQLKLKKEDIQEIFGEGLVPEDNVDFNNFLACYFRKTKITDENGLVDFNNLQADFLKDFKKLFGKNPNIESIIVGGLMKSAIKHCRQQPLKGSTEGQTAAKIINCIVGKVLEDAVEEKSEPPEE